MILNFSKMHGLGNDFMVIDGVRQRVRLSAAQIRQLGDRHTGVGFDQLLLVEEPALPDTDFRYRIFNSDGGEVEQCGNGARCFARFVFDQGLTDKHAIRVETAKGIITPVLTDNGLVTVDMGQPRLLPVEIPFEADADAVIHPLTLPDGAELGVTVVSMGNPHAVLRVDDVDTAPVAAWGPLLERHPTFPKRVNVGFLQVLDRQHVKLRVYERGAGETLACGTGACAAVVAGIRLGWLDECVDVQARGGQLTIAWAGASRLDAPVLMTGPAVTVFQGSIDVPDLA